MTKPILSAILSCKGYELTDEEKYFFSQSNPLGINLFSRNLKTKEQTKKLVETNLTKQKNGDRLGEESRKSIVMKTVTRKLGATNMKPEVSQAHRRELWNHCRKSIQPRSCDRGQNFYGRIPSFRLCCCIGRDVLRTRAG